MAGKRPAKIASQKQGKAWVRTCPDCDTEMGMAKILRVTGPSGMYWLCQNSSCRSLVTTSGSTGGKLAI